MQQGRLGSTALGVIVLATAAVLLLAVFSVRVVGVGEVGVISTFGVVDQTARQPGLLIKAPWQNLQQLSIRTQEFTMSSPNEAGQASPVGAEDTVQTLTSEGLTVGLDITIWYSVRAEAAPEIWRSIGPDYRNIIIRSAMRNAIRDVVAQYTAQSLYSEGRATVGNEVLDALRMDLDARGVLVERVLLRNVSLPPVIQQAIEAKLAAQQAIQERTFRVQEAEQEANRKVAEAEGQRRAQELINQTLTPEYLQYLYIQNLANQKDGNVIYVPVSPDSGLPVFVQAGGGVSGTP